MPGFEEWKDKFDEMLGEADRDPELGEEYYDLVAYMEEKSGEILENFDSESEPAY